MLPPLRYAFIRLQTLFGLALLIAPLAPHTAQAWTYKMLHSFCTDGSCYDGRTPVGGLVLGAQGNLYGMAYAGVRGDGVVFELIRPEQGDSWKERVLYNFCFDCKNGNAPASAPLVFDTNGNLYGIADGGKEAAGVVFRLTPSRNGKRWTQEVLYTFCKKDSRCTDGLDPITGLTYAGITSSIAYDGASPLYGITQHGGKYHNGIAYSLTPTMSKEWKLNALYSFCKDSRCKEGGEMNAFIADTDGNLIGPAQNRKGTILKISTDTLRRPPSVSVLYRFCSLSDCLDGKYPYGIAMDGGGNLLGATTAGGTNRDKKLFCYSGCGTLYQLAPDGTETVLYNFCSLQNCADGRRPDSVALNTSGGVFGTTQGSSGYYRATIFQYNAGGLHTLYTFCTQAGCPDGVSAAGPLVIDSLGNLFGITTEGGTRNAGTVFELSP